MQFSTDGIDFPWETANRKDCVQMLFKLDAAKECHTTKKYKRSISRQAVLAEITDDISDPRCTPTSFKFIEISIEECRVLRGNEAYVRLPVA
jgi:hypothetical protein